MFESVLLLTVGRAVVAGTVFLVGSIVAIRRSVTFRRRWYWWLLAFSLAEALLGPFFYIWITSYDVTLQDAILLRTFHAGSWHVAEGYCIFLGTAAGGLIGFGMVRRSKLSSKLEENERP